MSLFDKLADITDEDLAMASFLEAKDELKSERMSVDLNVRENYYDYHQALIQIETTLSRMRFREKEINILRAMVSLEEARMPALLNELVSMAEDRFGYVRTVTNLYLALSDMSRTMGIKDYFSEKEE